MVWPWPIGSGTIRISIWRELGRDELLPRNIGKGCEQALVADPACTKLAVHHRRPGLRQRLAVLSVCAHRRRR